MNTSILFMIFNNEVKYLNNSNMDHREWFLSLGGNPDDYPNLVRGFISNGKIVFYKDAFSYDEEVIKTAKRYAPSMKVVLGDNLEVWCGVLPGRPGEKWETIMKLNNNELTGFIQEPPTSPPKVEKEFVQESVLDFKNDYENPKFIKGATIITIIVIILTLISKIILISGKHFKMGFSYDTFLMMIEFITLGYCIYGFIKKKPNTKIVSMAAALSLVLMFNVIDVITGIIYFLFNVDSGYFTRVPDLINSLKSKILKK